MSAVDIYNMEIMQGADMTFEWILTDDNGDIKNISGYTAKMQIRRRTSDDSVLAEYSTTNGKLAVTGSSGKITLTLGHTDTAALTFTQGVYDLYIASATTVIDYITRGDVDVIARVTR
jgi:hypothetical protein